MSQFGHLTLFLDDQCQKLPFACHFYFNQPIFDINQPIFDQIQSINQKCTYFDQKLSNSISKYPYFNQKLSNFNRNPILVEIVI